MRRNVLTVQVWSWPGGMIAPAQIEVLVRTRYLARLAEQEGLQRDPAFTSQYAESLAALNLERKRTGQSRNRGTLREVRMKPGVPVTGAAIGSPQRRSSARRRIRVERPGVRERA